MYQATTTSIHNFDWPIDDYGNQIREGFSYYGWIYSTCTYGSFGEGISEEFCQDI